MVRLWEIINPEREITAQNSEEKCLDFNRLIKVKRTSGIKTKPNNSPIDPLTYKSTARYGVNKYIMEIANEVDLLKNF